MKNSELFRGPGMPILSRMRNLVGLKITEAGDRLVRG
jgi:hypothetical protein